MSKVNGASVTFLKGEQIEVSKVKGYGEEKVKIYTVATL